MAKKGMNLSFSKAVITFEEEGVFITEVDKDEIRRYDLLETLQEYQNLEGLTLKISREKQLPSA